MSSVTISKKQCVLIIQHLSDFNANFRHLTRGRRSHRVTISFLLPSFRMGSFTSMPKVIPAASESDCDADVSYPREGERQELGEFLQERCGRHLASLPPPIERRWRTRNGDNRRRSEGTSEDREDDAEKIRVLQWNVLSQGEFEALEGKLA